MRLFKTLSFVVVFSISQAWALAPLPEFVVKNDFGEVISYEIKGKDIEINGMTSEFSYDDLTEKEFKALDDLIKTKQEYGKVFGFADWKSSGKKLVEKNGERIALIQGSYKNNQNKIVNFIEVYWASKAKSGQYLITSDTLKLNMDQYSEYLK